MGQKGPISRRGYLSVFSAIGVGAILGKLDLSDHRSVLLPRLDGLANDHGKYTAYQLRDEEFVGRVTPHDGEFDLKARSYVPNPLAAAKYHPETEAVDDGSWRRIDEDHPRWQWHVHIWERETGDIELFSHYEYRPDPRLIGDESVSDMTQRLRDHYNPNWDIHHDDEDANYFLGVACPRIRQLVDN